MNFDEDKAYRAAALSVRDRLIESWNDTNAYYAEHDVRYCVYASAEFLLGRYFQNALISMGLEDNYKRALHDIGMDLESLFECEPDPALGNGGLGRLAACYLDSMATLDIPAWGYGIRYDYGIFKQRINDAGEQVETADYWLTAGNPWEIERLDVTYPVRFYGHVEKKDGEDKATWRGGEIVVAVAYDNPVPAYKSFNTNSLRLWHAAPAKEIDLAAFNAGDYYNAVEARARAERITSVLYPGDAHHAGKELRLKQQYFFMSATIQDIIRRFKKKPGREWSELPEKVCIQLNDTHPTIGVAEMQRILVDVEGLDWDTAWDLTSRCFAYTNHTLLPEALERWTVDLMQNLLPRHMEIIYRINWQWMQQVEAKYPGDVGKLERLSIIEESPIKSVRMANLAIVGSHHVNGVAAIHSELLRTQLFPDFVEIWPEKFVNVTNGVTFRRWIHGANPGLSAYISELLGSDEWLLRFDDVAGLRRHVDSPDVRKRWRAIKQANKVRLADYVRDTLGVDIDVTAMFDVQIKRIHEYKRQLMNALWCIHRYLELKRMTPAQRAAQTKRVTMFGGKAAPSYWQAKRIIKLINTIARTVNNDADVSEYFKVLFLPNYNVSLAEKIIPAQDVTSQISCASTEASGTGNFKSIANGALLLGTMDGANVEIAQECGEENLFIFGARVPEVPGIRAEQQAAPERVPRCAAWREVLRELEDSAATNGRWGAADDLRPLLDALRPENDVYLLGYDFEDYLRAQAEADALYQDKDEWTRRSMLMTAGCGPFSSDRSVRDYAENVWQLDSCRRPDPVDAECEEGKEALARNRSFPALVNPAADVPSLDSRGAALTDDVSSPASFVGLSIGSETGKPGAVPRRRGAQVA